VILFDNDLQIQGASVHVSTKNISFIRMSMVLKQLGVKNNKFFLALYDTSLANVDPHHLTPEQDNIDMKLRIAQECKINPWYYIREVVRVPSQGAENSPYILNRANLALNWCFFTNVDVFLTMPRQLGKTIGTIVLESFLMYISGFHTNLSLFTKDDNLIQENVNRLKVIRDSLPPYLVSKHQKDTDNKEGVGYWALRTKYNTYIAQKDKRAAEAQGRGDTSTCQHWDELAYFPNIDITYQSATTATITGKEQARSVGIPCANILTTTAGKLRDPSGRYAYRIRSKCLQFNDKMYDTTNMEELEKLLNVGSTNRMFYVEYSYLQLGKTKEWFIEVTKDKDPETVATDFLNRWLNNTSNPLLGQATSDKLVSSVIEPTTVTFMDSLMIRWYVDPNKLQLQEFYNRPLVIGMDISDNVGRDSTTFVITDPGDMGVVATIRCNTTNLTFIVRCAINLLLKFKRAVLIPERNRNGGMLIDMVIVALKDRNINPFKRIFNTIVQEHATTKEPHNIDKVDPTHGPIRSHFGFTTSKASSSRDMLYKTVFQETMKRNINRIYDQDIVNEACSLVIRNGRIDHAVEGHDDTLIAYLLTIYFILYGKELYMYGIKPEEFLNTVGDNGSTIDPVGKQRQKDYRALKLKLEQAISENPSELLRQVYTQQLDDIKSRIQEGVVDDEIFSVTQMKASDKQERGPGFDLGSYDFKMLARSGFM
jgi:hypothetical protein